MKSAPVDPTPTVGSATDVAPLGRDAVKPGHERTAEDPDGNKGAR
jgi:hypothetical protein